MSQISGHHNLETVVRMYYGSPPFFKNLFILIGGLLLYNIVVVFAIH